MKVFVWQNVDQCSGNYHSDGGVVVFAHDLRRARILANMQPGCAIRDDEEPDEVRDVIGPQFGGEAVYIMPDAGCC